MTAVTAPRPLKKFNFIKIPGRVRGDGAYSTDRNRYTALRRLPSLMRTRSTQQMASFLRASRFLVFVVAFAGVRRCWSQDQGAQGLVKITRHAQGDCSDKPSVGDLASAVDASALAACCPRGVAQGRLRLRRDLTVEHLSHSRQYCHLGAVV